MPVSYQVYVIENPQKRFYIGLSEDIGTRLEQHNSSVSKWTASRGPWAIVWKSELLSLCEARKLELFLKRQKGGAGFYQFTGLSRRS